MRKIRGEINALSSMAEDELFVAAKGLQAPTNWFVRSQALARPWCCSPPVDRDPGRRRHDDAFGRRRGVRRSGIFKSGNPAQRAHAIVQATTHFDNPDVLAKVSRGLRKPWSASTSRNCRSTIGSPSAAGEPAPTIGVLACKGRSANICGCCGRWAPRPAVPHPDEVGSGVGLGHPRRGVGGHLPTGCRPGNPGTDRRTYSRRHARLRDLRQDDPSGGSTARPRSGQQQFGRLDLTVRRNAFGRQVESFETPVSIPAVGSRTIPVFIRAPWVSRPAQQSRCWPH